MAELKQDEWLKVMARRIDRMFLECEMLIAHSPNGQDADEAMQLLVRLRGIMRSMYGL
jgi:hypothetical protein